MQHTQTNKLCFVQFLIIIIDNHIVFVSFVFGCFLIMVIIYNSVNQQRIFMFACARMLLSINLASIHNEIIFLALNKRLQPPDRNKLMNLFLFKGEVYSNVTGFLFSFSFCAIRFYFALLCE